ncbi:hypothetical protein LCGC14_1048160 [marine sediment metagenome]|uniref:Uncharacterized protein n=1 Tax=marine sediment metagenome TaxID=412755 RepID=A0A0F9MPQ0_9ZZZZ
MNKMAEEKLEQYIKEMSTLCTQPITIEVSNIIKPSYMQGWEDCEKNFTEQLEDEPLPKEKK